MGVSPERFDHDFYLEAWPDVRQAILQGQYLSAWHHWKECGHAEGRIYKTLANEATFGTKRPGEDLFVDTLTAFGTWTQTTYEHRGLSVRSCLEPKVKDRLAEETREIRKGTIVEIGVYGGSTILHLAQRAKDNGTKLIGIDPWEKAADGLPASAGHRQDYIHFASQLRWNIQHAVEILKYDNVEIWPAFSNDAAVKFEPESIDFLIVDGDHSYQAVSDDLEKWWPKVKVGGTMWGDDYDQPGVSRAADEFFVREGLQPEIWRRQFVIRKVESRLQ